VKVSFRVLLFVVTGLLSVMTLCSCQSDHADASLTDGAIGVEQFMRGVDKYPGVVQVEGVVSNVASEDQLFTLIDVREFKACGVTDCAPLSLPVRWNGALPAVKDLVRVRGQVEEIQGKLVFAAASLTTSQHPADVTN